MNFFFIAIIVVIAAAFIFDIVGAVFSGSINDVPCIKNDHHIKNAIHKLRQERDKMSPEEFFDRKHALHLQLSTIPEEAKKHEAWKVRYNGVVYYTDMKFGGRYHLDRKCKRIYVDADFHAIR